MKTFQKIFLLTFIIALLSFGKTFAQIPVTGKWQSTSKNIFYLVDTPEGFKYQNTKTKTWFFTKWQNKYDLNKYLVYKDSNEKKKEMYITVKKENGITSLILYDSSDGTTNTWTKIGD